MATINFSADEAATQALLALKRGEYSAARRWAQVSLSLDPRLEDGWLLLAAVAKPRASLAYLKQALEINPASERARKGLEWARRRLEAQPTKPASAPAVVVPTPKTHNLLARGRALNRQSLFAVVAIVLIVITVGWAFWPGLPGQAETRASAPIWSALGIIKPTYTLTPSSTPTATNTPTATLTPTSTNTPTETPTAIPTETPSPTATPFQPAPATPLPSYEKKIVVSISQQHLWAYEGDTQVYSFVASTGMNNATRVGTFAVQSKIPNAYGATWNIWMPHWLGIYWAGSLENGIHALPILSNGATLWAGYLGTPISFGCVVLGTYEAGLLYDWAEIGTPVIIQR